MKIAILLSFLSLMCSFAGSDSDDALIGVWVFSKSNNVDGVAEYVKSKAFIDDRAGMEFKPNGRLIKRQNVSWCGTHPITYGNYKGTWKFTSDSTLTIRYEYWGGEAEQDWHVEDLSDQILRVRKFDWRKL